MESRHGTISRTFRSAAVFPVSPAAATGQISGSGRWAGAFLLVSLLTVSGGILHLAGGEVVLDALPQGHSGPLVRPVTRLLAVGGVLLAPLGLLVKWLLFGGLLLAVLRLLDLRRPAWRDLYALLAHGETIFAVTVLASGLVVLYQAVSGGGIVPPPVLDGLALLMPPSLAGTPLELMASQISVFSGWYVVALGVGLSVLGGESRAMCIGATALAWLVQAIVAGAVHWTLNSPPGS